ncbi:MAG: response regulator [Myxococcota bacterium]
MDASWVARRTLAKLLIPHGCVVSDAKDSVTARGLMVRRNFDLILLEVNLQGESGLDFCRALRAEGLTERMAVVMTSSGSTSDQVVQSIHAGASFFLVKPIGEQYLLRVLSGVLRQYRSGAQKVAAG